MTKDDFTTSASANGKSQQETATPTAAVVSIAPRLQGPRPPAPRGLVPRPPFGMQLATNIKILPQIVKPAGVSSFVTPKGTDDEE